MSYFISGRSGASPRKSLLDSKGEAFGPLNKKFPLPAHWETIRMSAQWAVREKRK